MHSLSSESNPQDRIQSQYIRNQEYNPSNKSPRSTKNSSISKHNKSNKNFFQDISKEGKKLSKKPEVSPLPKFSSFERKLRNIRILFGIDEVNSSNNLKNDQDYIRNDIHDKIFKFLCDSTKIYDEKKKESKNDYQRIEIEIEYYRKSISYILSVLSSEEVTLSENIINFLTEYIKKAEDAVTEIPKYAGPYNHFTGAISSTFSGKYYQHTQKDSLWKNIPGVKCVYLPIETQEGPQEIEIKPYPRTKRDLEIYFKERGLFSSGNSLNETDLQLQFFVVTRNRPVVAFRTSKGQTPFTKSNKLVEKWINDTRVKKFFGPVVLLKITCHDPETDELEIGNYTMKDLDKQIYTNFSPEELVSVNVQLKQYANLPPLREKCTSSFILDINSLFNLVYQFFDSGFLKNQNWNSMFSYNIKNKIQTSHQNFICILYNIIRSSLSNGAYKTVGSFKIINTELQFNAFNDSYINENSLINWEDNLVFIVLNELNISNEETKVDPIPRFKLQFIGKWSDILEIIENPQEIISPPFCVSRMNILETKKKNTIFKSQISELINHNSNYLPSRLRSLSDLEIQLLFSAIDSNIESKYLKEELPITVGMINNSLRLLIPLQFSEMEDYIYDGAIAVEVIGNEYLGNCICSIDEAFVAIHSVSGTIETWIDKASTHVLTLEFNSEIYSKEDIDTLHKLILNTCQLQRVDVFYWLIENGLKTMDLSFYQTSLPYESKDSDTICVNEFNIPKRVYLEIQNILNNHSLISKTFIRKVEMRKIEKIKLNRVQL